MLNGFQKFKVTNDEKNNINSFNIAKLLNKKTFNFRHCIEQYSEKDRELLKSHLTVIIVLLKILLINIQKCMKKN